MVLHFSSCVKMHIFNLPPVSVGYLLCALRYRNHVGLVRRSTYYYTVYLITLLANLWII